MQTEFLLEIQMQTKIAKLMVHIIKNSNDPTNLPNICTLLLNNRYFNYCKEIGLFDIFIAGESIFSYVCRTNQEKLIIKFIDLKQDINKVNEGFSPTTPFIELCKNCKNPDIFDYVLKHSNPDFNFLDSLGSNCFILAACEENIVALKFLADKVNINHQCNSKATALHLCSVFGKAEIVEYLLQIGVKTSLKNCVNYTAYEIATPKVKLIFEAFLFLHMAQQKID